MKTNRLAVSIFFLANGFLYANWTSRIPEIQAYFDISNSMLGTLLFSAAVGALLAMPFSGWLTTKFGSKNITIVSGLLMCLVIPALVFFPSVQLAIGIFFINGLIVGAMDVSMNGQAVFVERTYQRPIMSSFHAIFSIGMALGAGSGALFARMEYELFQHLVYIAIPCILGIAWASFHLINDRPKIVAKNTESESMFVLPTKAILPLGIIAFCCMTGEGSMADWSALFMKKVIGQSEFYSALAFGTFATSMTIGRLFGDYFTEQLGKYRLLIYNSVFAVLGLSIVLVFATTWSTILGFFLVGLGLSTIVPIVYSTAGNIKGVEPSVGIAMATTIGYAGFFVGPPTIGFLADWFDLRVGLGFTLLLFAMMLILVFIEKKKAV